MLSQKSKLKSPSCSEKHIKLTALGALMCQISKQAAAVCVYGAAGGSAAAWYSGSSVLHGMLSCHPQEGTVSPGGTAVTVSPPAGPGGKEGL